MSFLGWFDKAVISPVEPGKLIVQVAGEEDVEEKGGRGGSLAESQKYALRVIVENVHTWARFTM